ncbi:MAG: STAS/SEC14 domain-containing protein [Alphaproteobacteria bacterium]|nr:STAS/SEC14 domain-containing protein [Alphaproteobacteria bacterium]
MIELLEDLPRNVVGISVKGRVTKEECQEILAPAIAKSLKWRDKIRLYYELGSRFPGSGWDDLDLGFEHATCCERIAIVTDIAWVRLTVKAIRFLIPGEIRVFDTSEAEEARAWITARPGSRADTEAAEPVRTLRVRPRRAQRVPARPRVAAARMRREHEELQHSYGD